MKLFLYLSFIFIFYFLGINKNMKFSKFNKERLQLAELNEEKIFRPLISGLFENSNWVKLDTFNTFDFVNEDLKVFIEVKEFNSLFGQYNQILIGYNKIIDGLDYIKNGYAVYFIIKFADGIFKILELNEKIVSDSAIKSIYEKDHLMIDKKFYEDLTEEDRIYFII